MLALSGNPGLHYAPHLHPSSTNTSTGTFTSPTDLYYHPGSTPISTSVPTPSHSSTQIFPVDYSTPFISTRSRIKEDLSSGSGQLDLYHNSKDTQSQGPAEGMHRKMEEMKQFLVDSPTKGMNMGPRGRSGSGTIQHSDTTSHLGPTYHQISPSFTLHRLEEDSEDSSPTIKRINPQSVQPRLIRPTPIRSQSLRTPQNGGNLLLRPSLATRQGSWSGELGGNQQFELTGQGQGSLNYDQEFGWPVRPHTTQPMDTPLARYGSGAGGLMMHHYQQQHQLNQQQEMMTVGNQDPFALSTPIVRPQTVHMEDLVPQANAFGGRPGSVGIPGDNGSAINNLQIGSTLGRPSSVFSQRMNVDYEDDEEEDDASTASPTDKGARSGSRLGTHPLSISQGNRLRANGSPAGTVVSRSMTPFSESSYQPSVASTKRVGEKKKVIGLKMGSRLGRGEVDDDVDEDDEEDDDESEQEEEEQESASDADEDEEGDTRGPSSRTSTRIPQVSPTKTGKGKHDKNGKQTLLSTKKSTVANTKKNKGDVKVRDAARKPPNNLNVKAAAAAEKDKPYVPENLPPPPRSSDKPSWSYAALIGQAILGSSRKRLALNQIYAWISAAYPYFKPGESGWMNSIRHNLSLNDCFVKGERNADEKGGKGSVWMIDPALEFQFKDGGFKKQQKARQVPPTDPDNMSSVMKSGKKRKVGGGDEIKRNSSAELGTPMIHGTPLSIPSDHHPTPHVLQCSPLTAEAPMSNKRPRLEKANTWATPVHPGSRPGSGMNFRRNSAIIGPNGMIEMDDENGQIIEYRRMSGSPSIQSAPSSGVLMDRGSPEDMLPHHAHLSMGHPASMGNRVSQQGPHHQFNADDYTTPNRPLSSNPLHRPHLLSSSMMVPGLTPSASSPVSSSPYPATNPRNHIMDRRMAHFRHPSDLDEVRIRGDDDGLSSDPAAPPDTFRKPYNTGLQPAPQLGGAFVAPLPPTKFQRPKTMPLETNLTSNTAGNNTLSPIVDRKPHRTTKSVSLPGPGSLLSQSPRTSSERSSIPAADVLGHLDRLPRSPIGPSYSTNANSFATPMNPMSRHRTAGFTPRSNVLAQLSTPSRNNAGIPHETPIGNVKAQFKAEHRLLDSPMGLNGSCYDLTDHSYQVDWELEQMTSRGSPTTATTQNGCRRIEGESVARTLFEVETGPFSDP